MTLTPESEHAVSIDWGYQTIRCACGWDDSSHPTSLNEHLAAIEAAVRAEQAAEIAELRRAIALTTGAFEAEFERLREALAEAMDWLERSDREQNVHQFRHGMLLLRAARAAHG